MNQIFSIGGNRHPAVHRMKRLRFSRALPLLDAMRNPGRNIDGKNIHIIIFVGYICDLVFCGIIYGLKVHIHIGFFVVGNLSCNLFWKIMSLDLRKISSANPKFPISVKIVHPDAESGFENSIGRYFDSAFRKNFTDFFPAPSLGNIVKHRLSFLIHEKTAELVGRSDVIVENSISHIHIGFGIPI